MASQPESCSSTVMMLIASPPVDRASGNPGGAPPDKGEDICVQVIGSIRLVRHDPAPACGLSFSHCLFHLSSKALPQHSPDSGTRRGQNRLNGR